MNILMEKIGDSNIRIREGCESSFLSLCQNDNIGVAKVTQILLHYQTKGKYGGFKQIQGRLNIMEKAIEQMGVG